MSILKNKTNEIMEEGNFGVVMTIAAILSIIVSSIRLYQLCKNSDRELFEGLKNVTLAQRVVLNRHIKKELPTLNREDRKKLLNIIIEKANKMDWEEFRKILEEARKL